MLWFPKIQVSLLLDNESFLELIDKYGKHTLEMHFRNTNSLSSEDIPNDFSGIDNIGNTCYMSAVL